MSVIRELKRMSSEIGPDSTHFFEIAPRRRMRALICLSAEIACRGLKSVTRVSSQESDCRAVSRARGARSLTQLWEQSSDCRAVSPARGARSLTQLWEQSSD